MDCDAKAMSSGGSSAGVGVRSETLLATEAFGEAARGVCCRECLRTPLERRGRTPVAGTRVS